MKQLTIRKLLFLLVGLVSTCLLFLGCLKTCNHSKLPPTTFQKSKNKKELLCVRPSPNRSVHYVEITIRPPTTGAELSQFTLTALTLAGHGELMAALDKDKRRLQYKVSLTKETKLSHVYLSKGNATMFKQGKSIGLRCRYEPENGTQQGEAHQVQISVCVYDSSHQLLEHEMKEVSFLIMQVPKAEEPK